MHDFNDDTNDAAPEMPADKPVRLGMVASPARYEATSGRFHFWVTRDLLTEKTQLVRTISRIGGREITFYGVVDEVYRRSRRRSMDEEVDAYDYDLDYEPPFALEGVTFAEVMILGTNPPVLTPPLEQCIVYLGGAEEAALAYGYAAMVDEMTKEDWGLPIGLVRNGSAANAGPARIDLRDLNGDRAGHLNVTGQAGRGTKSSFVLFVTRSLIDYARAHDSGNARQTPFSVRPIVFNVKGNDLMYIDKPNRYLTDAHRAVWEAVGLKPTPFTDAAFFAPCATPHNRGLARVNRPVTDPKRQTQTYYWTLEDVIRFGLWEYLFSDETRQSEPMTAMIDHLLDRIAVACKPDRDHPAGLKLRDDAPRSFAALRTELEDALQHADHRFRNNIHTFSTCRALLSRLGLVLGQEGRTIFDDGLECGKPLTVIEGGTTDPLVIDIAALPNELRRFVVAAVLDQVKNNQLGMQRVPGQVYFLVLDELGIYAPRGARDPITRLFEHVAAQLRSQGIILLGAQQQASKVSETIFGNSEFKALGGTSPVELDSPAWSHLLSKAQKERAALLRPEEKLVLTARGWMSVQVPYPAWAMKESEAVRGGEAGDAPIIFNRPRD